ncbi:MAG: hypothetical protein P3X22_005115 [Thermoprotei archaeon]|nr:hypothetical protein [Thermoprotei archaeon]
MVMGSGDRGGEASVRFIVLALSGLRPMGYDSTGRVNLVNIYDVGDMR